MIVNFSVLVSESVDRVEKRRFVRVKKVLRVQYAVLSAAVNRDAVYKTAGSLNISAEGMNLEVPEYIGEGEQLMLHFILPIDNKYTSFKELSRVTRVIAAEKNMFHIGVEFTNIQKKNSNLISRYVMKTIWTQALQ